MAVETALVVDDSKSARVMLSRLLKKSGVDVAFAESAEEAFDYLNDAKPDLIFMDHMMPGMDGLHAVKLLASDARFAHIPVVMYTSKEDDGYLAKARAVGAVGVIGKPAKPALVQRVLTDVNSLLVTQGAGESVPKPQVPAAPPETHTTVAATPAPTNTAPVPAAVAASTEPQRTAAATVPTVVQVAQSEASPEISSTTAEQVAELVDRQVDSVLKAELQSRVAEAVSHRIHEVVDGIKIAIKTELEQGQLRYLKERMDQQEARNQDHGETQEHISSIYEQISNYRDRLRDLDTKITDVEYTVSGLNEKYVLKHDFQEKLEETKDYVHKEVTGQLKPIEVGLSQKLQALDSEKDEYQQFAVQLARDLYPVFEARLEEKMRELIEESKPKPEDEPKKMRVVSGPAIMSTLSFAVSIGLAAFILLQQVQ